MTSLFDDETRGAVIDGNYRYRLFRRLSNGQRRLGVLGLNPSTADDTVDDHTIRKLRGYAKRWGFDVIDVGNVFAWRATDPSVLPAIADPIGSTNALHLEDLKRKSDMLLVMCGDPGWRRGRELAWETIARLNVEKDLHALKVTRGFPHHCLYLRNDAEPFLYRKAA